MGTEPQPWHARSADDVLMEPEKFLAELGWSANSAPPVKSGIGKTDEAERLYCSFCWAILPTSSTECADCGTSVAEMEAARTVQREADKNWIPPRQWAEKGPKPPPPGVKVPPPAPKPRVRRVPVPDPLTIAMENEAARASSLPSWKHLVLAIGVGGFVGGATVAVMWVTFQTFGRPAGATGVPGGGKPAAMTLAPAKLSWRNPVSELRLELIAPNGVVAADSSKGNDAGAVDPGEYHFRITDNTGKWSPPVERVIVAPSEALTIGPPPKVVASYYLWAGKKLYEQKKLDRAQRVWEKAIKAYPEGADARLQLAALLAVKYQYKAAMKQVAEVLKRQPNNGEARRLRTTLSELEASR